MYNVLWWREMDRELNAWEDATYIIGRNALLHARVNGNVDEASARTALKKLQARHPMARVVWKLDPEGNPRLVTNPTLEIPLVMEARLTENSWIEAANRSLNVGFRDNIILLRVVILEGELDFDILVIADHAISDGLSLLFVLRDILEFMSDPSDEGNPFTELPSLDEMLPPAVAGMIQALKVNPPQLQDTNEKLEPDINSFRNEIKNTTIYPWIIGRDLLDAFLHRCKTEGITFHSGFSVAVLLARAREPWCTNPPFLIPVNFRKMLTRDVGENFGFFISNVFIEQKIKEPVEFWKVCKKYNKRLKEALQETSIFGTYALYKTMTRTARFNQISQFKINDTPFISNMGLIPIPTNIGSYHIESVHVCANMGRNDIGLGLATSNNHVDLTFLFDDREYSNKQMEDLAKKITKIMDEAVKLPG